MYTQRKTQHKYCEQDFMNIDRHYIFVATTPKVQIIMFAKIPQINSLKEVT